jgi:hypothetical protein
MFRHIARRDAVEAWVVGDLDLAAERPEARTLVERQCCRMIEGTGVQPEARDVARPR